MWQELLGDARLYALLVQFDVDLAKKERAGGCPWCGGVLHAGNYERKPRGGPSQVVDGMTVRLSFCCARDGCRARLTPPSLRFLGRKVYLGAVMVLLTVMTQGVTEGRARELRALVGVDRRTLGRWRVWWWHVFANSAFWRMARGFLLAPVAEGELPGGLLERFTGTMQEKLVGLLRFISPITTMTGRDKLAK